MSDKTLIGVTALCIYPCGKVLALYHNKTGGISLPGGSVEPGEVPIDAFYREMKEELGLAKDEIEIIREEVYEHHSEIDFIEHRFLIKPPVNYRNMEPDKHMWVAPISVIGVVSRGLVSTDVARSAFEMVELGHYKECQTL